MEDRRQYGGSSASSDKVSHPDHLALLKHWTAIKPENGLPSRVKFDPTGFRSLLARLAIIEPFEINGQPTYRYRLAGTEIAARAGRDPTGKSFEELYSGEYLTTAKKTYDEITACPEPHFSQRVFPIGEKGNELRYDRIILPFSDNNVTVTSFVLCIVVISQPEQYRIEGSFKKYT